MDQLNLSVWAGKTKTERDCITAERAKMIHATVGLAGSDAPQMGDPMPGLWHWCAFGPDAMTRDFEDELRELEAQQRQADALFSEQMMNPAKGRRRRR